MEKDTDATSQFNAPLWIVAVAFAGAVSALAGGYWDDAWHTERGRDTFFVPPHIAIYAGITVAGGALTLWAALAVRAGHSVRTVLAHKPLALALLSVGVTLASGPIDNIWHEAFGKDAVFWSPPHMLGIAGTLALAAAILAEFAQQGRRSSHVVSAIAGALVLAAAAFPVVEYDTDVPQFDNAWYLPALALCSAIGLVIVRLASDRRYAATEAAAVHLVFIAAVAAFLVAVDFPTPGLPLLIPAAAVLDLTTRARWPAWGQAAAFTAALYAVYVPVRNWAGDGVYIDLDDVLIGLPIAFLASWAVLATATRRSSLWSRSRRRLPAAATAVLLLSLAVAPAVMAHDPGQGKDAGELNLTVTAQDRAITLMGEARGANCQGLEARSLAVRRAGQTLRAPLELTGCRFTGRIVVPDRGRWFVYAELRRDGREIESWLPVEAGDGTRRNHDAARYAYEPDDSSAGSAQFVAGILLYAGMAALVVATFRLVRRPGAPTPAVP